MGKPGEAEVEEEEAFGMREREREKWGGKGRRTSELI